MANLPYSPSKSSSFLRIEDLDEVSDVLRRHQYSSVNSYQLGLSLGLLSRTLDKIEREHSQNVDRCLLECLRQWLKQADNVMSKGGPTWYALIKALRSLGDVAVADGIDKEKHPACLILSNHQSQLSAMNALQQLGQLLSQEGLIGDMLQLPTTSKELMSGVQKAVCADHHNLVKFASVLRKLVSTISIGDAILAEYRKVYTATSQEGEEGAVVRISLTLSSEFAGVRAKYAHMFYEVKKAMTTSPSAVCVEDLKSYLRSGYLYLKPQLSQCKTISDVIEVISERSSLNNVDILEGVVDKFDNEQAKSFISTYKEDVANFCGSIALRLILNEQFSSPAILLCETATFLVDRLIDDETFKDIEILVNIAFKNKAKIVVIKEGNSFSITCSFPLTLSHTLIINALQNIEQLKERGVYQLTVGYCTVYKRDLTEAEEGIVQQSTISSGGMEQIMVAQCIQLIEREEEITSLNKDKEQLTEKNKLYEEQIALQNEQVATIAQFNILKEDTDDVDSEAIMLSKEKENESGKNSHLTLKTSTQTDNEPLSDQLAFKIEKNEDTGFDLQQCIFQETHDLQPEQQKSVTRELEFMRMKKAMLMQIDHLMESKEETTKVLSELSAERLKEIYRLKAQLESSEDKLTECEQIIAKNKDTEYEIRQSMEKEQQEHNELLASAENNLTMLRKLSLDKLKEIQMMILNVEKKESLQELKDEIKIIWTGVSSLLNQISQPPQLITSTSHQFDAASLKTSGVDYKKSGPSLCLIINNFNYQRFPQRYGSHKDVEGIREVFNRERHFTVHLFEDRTADEICAHLESLSNPFYNKFRCIFIFFLVYGYEGGIYGVDEEELSIYKIQSFLSAKNCPPFAGKAKILVFQSSREIKEDIVGAFGMTEDDFLLAFSAQPRGPSYRHVEDGSFYIQCLLKVIREEGETEDLLSILTSARREIRRNHKFCQTPLVHDFLTGKVFIKKQTKKSNETVVATNIVPVLKSQNSRDSPDNNLEQVSNNVESTHDEDFDEVYLWEAEDIDTLSTGKRKSDDVY